MDGINTVLTAQEENFSSATQKENHETLSTQRAQELNDKYLPRPLPLQREMAPPKSFPFEALGPVLGPVAKRIHEIVKAPDSVCGQSLLAVASLLAQPYANVEIDGREYPISLFVLTIAESGDRKSAVDAIVLKPIRDYEKMLDKSCIEEKRIYKNKLDAWKKQRDLIMRSSEPEELEQKLNQMSPEPSRPLEPFLLLEEPSYEGLVKLYAIGQPSIGLFSDEGGRMFGGYSMGKENLLKTACGLSSLWDGKPITRIRGGDQNLLLHGRRFCSHLMMQEVVLGNILKNELLQGQGLLARCLIAAPVSNAGNRCYNPVDVSQDPLIQGFYAHVSALLDQPFPLANSDIGNELAPRALPLSFEAKNSWVLFHDEIDRSLKPDGALYSIRRMANKAAEQALRISGILTLMENFEACSIPSGAMERAIALTRYYLDEALRIADMSFLDSDLELAQAVLMWMKKKAAIESHEKIFSLQEIYQKAGPRGVRNKKMAQKVMGILEDHKEVERLPTQAKLEWRLTSRSEI
jgi:hypothetical protein